MIGEFFSLKPGTRILLHSETADDEEIIIRSVSASVPDSLHEKTKLNTCSVLSMSITGDEGPNDFRDLAVLCKRLVIAAGKSSHFRGLLLLNISSLLKKKEDVNRLRALGEVLALKDGLASQCITVCYGASNEKELLVAADSLDFDGNLMIEKVQLPKSKASVQAVAKEAGIKLSNDHAAHLLQSTLSEMQEDSRFDALKFLKTCEEEGGIITEQSVLATLDNPYSYINRFKKMKAILSEEKDESARRIGF